MPLGQWLNAHEGSRQPNIMSDADDEETRGLRAFLLRMLSYLPDDRPKIAEVCKNIQEILERTGGSANDLVSCY